jgi:hypothetical protein
MEGVVKLNVPLPPANTAPPDAAAYQSIVSPAPADAESTTVPVPQRAALTGETGASGSGFTVTGTEVLLQPVVADVNVNVAVPAATPVTTPAFVMVATEGLLLTHVPPVVGDNVIVLSTQTAAGPESTGNARTVTAEVVFVQPVEANVNVKVGDPGATPVTTPSLVTVANALLLLVHVPPVVGDNVIVLPTQTAAGAATTGRGFTVTAVVVLLQPVDVRVYVNVTVPSDTPVTTPAFVTVATAGLLLTQVPSVEGVKLIVLPTQTAAGAVTIGSAFTVTFAVVLEQPVDASVNVNVTIPFVTAFTLPLLVMVATAGLLLTQFPPVEGLRLYTDPTHINVGEVNTGNGFTITSAVLAGLVHPFTVMVKLYVPEAIVCALVIDGVRETEVNPLGPVQAYVAPVTAGVDNDNVVPWQITGLVVIAGATGIG